MSDHQSKFKIDDEDELVLSLSGGVFEPTGTTAVLVEAVLDSVNKPGKLLDLGCGCGVVGLALQKKGIVEAPLFLLGSYKKIATYSGVVLAER